MSEDPELAREAVEAAHDADFKCLLAVRGDAGLALVHEFMPDAVVLSARAAAASRATRCSTTSSATRRRATSPSTCSSEHERRARRARWRAPLGCGREADRPRGARRRLRRARRASSTGASERCSWWRTTSASATRLDRADRRRATSGSWAPGRASRRSPSSTAASSTAWCWTWASRTARASGCSSAIKRGEALPRPAGDRPHGQGAHRAKEEARLRRYAESIIVEGRTLTRAPARRDGALPAPRGVAPARRPAAHARAAAHRRRGVRGQEGADRRRRRAQRVRAHERVRAARDGGAVRRERARRDRGAAAATPTSTLVLMDIMMPEMDGYEATRAVREMPEFEQLPIVALTAKAMKGDREKSIASGASDYITKPVDIDQLLSLMRVWLHRLAGGMPRGGAGILVVDDQPENLHGARGACSSRSAAEVVTARSGEEALRRLLDDDFGVIVHGRADAGARRLRDGRADQAARRATRTRPVDLPHRRRRGQPSRSPAATRPARSTTSSSRSIPRCCARRSRCCSALAEKNAALRESEERFRAAFEDAPIGMGLSTLDGRLARGERGALRHARPLAPCSCCGQPLWELVASGRPGARAGGRRAAARDGRGSHQAEVRFTRQRRRGSCYALVSVSLAIRCAATGRCT